MKSVESFMVFKTFQRKVDVPNGKVGLINSQDVKCHWRTLMLPPSLASPFYFLLLFCPNIQKYCFRQLDAFPLVFPSYFFWWELRYSKYGQNWWNLVTAPSLKSGSMQACTILLHVRRALQEGLRRGFLKYFHSNNNTTAPLTPQCLVNPK